MASQGGDWIEQHVGAIAHDLRGPLSVVSGHAQVLRRMCEAGAPHEKMLSGVEAILRSALKMSALIDSLVADGQERASSPPLEPVSVEDLLGHALRGDRGRLVDIELEPGLPPVTVDRQATELRIAALFGALLAGRHDARLTVRAERRGDAVRVTLDGAWFELPVA